MAYHKVASCAELWSGEMLGVTVEGIRVLLVNAGDVIRAYEDRCVHHGARLSEGCLRDGVLVCPVHSWEFDARTGQGINPRRAALKTLQSRIDGEDILVDI